MDAFQLRPLPSDGWNTWNTMPGHISYNIADTKTVDKPSPVAKIRYAMSESPALDDTIILVTVFHIHESILRTSSPTLNNALKPPWKESSTRTFTLPECSRPAFAIYASWLYNGRIGITDGNEDGDERAAWEKCYELADYLQDRDFSDALIDVAREIGVAGWGSLGAVVYAHSRITSAHRKFAVESVGMGLEMWELEGLAAEAVCEVFVVDLFMWFVRKTRGEEDVKVEKKEDGEGEGKETEECKWHEHGRRDGDGQGGECYRVKQGWLYQ